MRAAICRHHGRPQTLEVGEVPTPVPGPGEVRIRVRACGINFPDLLLIAGRYQDQPALPFVPGGEVAGIIDQVGANVSHLVVGQPVMATVFLGGLAEAVVARIESVDPLPPGMSMTCAAAFPGAYGTSYHALRQRAALQPGETLLVLGAAGGVGIAAVQIGKAFGARVIAAAGSDDKLAFARRHGADEGINYTTTPLRDAAMALTGGRGVDAVFDPVGGAQFDAAVRCTGWNGRILVVGFASGTIPTFPLNRALLKGLSVVGVYYGRFRQMQPDDAAANMAALYALHGEGKISPPIHRTFPLEEVAAALDCLASRTVMGKVVVMTGA